MIVAPPISPSGLLKFEWIDPTGVVHDLTRATSPNLFVSHGSAGLGAPPISINEEKLPFISGSVMRRVNVQPVKMSIPITVAASSMANLIGIADYLRLWFDTGDEKRRTPGIFRITREDDTIRQRVAYYTGGLEGEMREGTPDTHTYVVDLFAPDGHPTAKDPQELEYDTSDFASPLPIMNSGQMDAFPVWTFTGPGNGIVIGNLTTGTVWAYTTLIADGDTLTVDTRPSSLRTTQPVIDQDGENLWPNFYPTSSLWHLAPGLNMISATATSTNGNTRLAVSFLERYRGMLR